MVSQALNNCRLAYSWFTNEGWIILGSAAEDLSYSFNLLNPPDNRVKFPSTSGLGQVNT